MYDSCQNVLQLCDMQFRGAIVRSSVAAKNFQEVQIRKPGLGRG